MVPLKALRGARSPRDFTPAAAYAVLTEPTSGT